MTIWERSTIVSDSTSTPSRVRTSAASFGVTPSRSTNSPSHSYEMRTSVAQHLRMHHPAAAHLEPSLMAAALAAHPAADPARNVELEARLGEGEVAGAHAHLALASVQRLDHVEQRALHVAHRESLVHSKPFDLAEVRQPRRFRRVAAVAPTWRDDVDRRLLDALHGVHLHRGRIVL